MWYVYIIYIWLIIYVMFTYDLQYKLTLNI